MEERVAQLLPIGYFDLWISTFHSFGERVLKEYGIEIGLPTDFKLLNEFEQWALIKRNIDKFDLDYYRPIGNPAKFINALVKHFSRLKDEDISPGEYLKYAEELKENMDNALSGGRSKNKLKNIIALTTENSRQSRKAGLCQADKEEAKMNKEILQQEIRRINEAANAYYVYQQLLADNNVLDFGDLINYSLQLFKKRPKILSKFRKNFKYILLDEFQDTNWAQYELIKLLAAPKNNIVVVGDDDQSIYKFRGASISNILQFKKDYPEAEQIFLIRNYRNKQNILDLSYNFIKQNDPNRLEYQLRKKFKVKSEKLSKRLIAQNESRGIIEVIRGKDLTDEVRQVVEKIADLKIKSKGNAADTAQTNNGQKELSWNDFGILVRANDSAKEICSALDQAGLPYIFLAARGLYTKPVIMDVVSYFKLLDNYHESPALYRVLNLPIFEFTYQELVNLNYIAYKKAWSLFSALESLNGKLGQEIQAKADRVMRLIAKHTALVRAKNASEILISFLNDSGYLKYLTSQDERTSRENMAYLNKFMKRIQAFEAGSDDKSIKVFLEELSMEIDSGEQGVISPDIEAGPEAIKIMTVHGAKGLEFKYVFITNMVDKRFPTLERREQIEIPDALVKEILPEGDIHTEEERRLCYVAMTRAKDGLYFSWAKDYGGARKKKPSRFLIECGLIKDEEKEKAINKDSDEKNGIDPLIYQARTETKDKELSYQAPSYFSYTQLAAFSNCPYQYRLAHILRIPRRGKAQFSFGKTMHTTLQKIFELANEKKGLGQSNLFGTEADQDKPVSKINISIDEIINIYKSCWLDDWYDSKEQKEKHQKLGKKILKRFYEKYRDNWPQAIFLEKGFNIKVEANKQTYTVKGKIDRIDKVGDKIKIIDYKTGSPKEKLDFADKEQLLIYQLAIQDLFKYEVAALSFYYLKNNLEVEFLGTEKELEKVKKKIILTIGEINKGEFPPRPSMLCKYCDFFDICQFRKN